MPYATQADMEAFSSVTDLVALTDRVDPPVNVINVALLAEQLNRASELMDGYFARQYTVPLVSHGDDVTLRCAQITYYHLHRDSAPEKVRKDYEDAMRWLRDVSDGRVKLSGGQAAAPAAAGDGAAHVGADKVFSRDSMRCM